MTRRPVVDAHAHLVPPALVELVRSGRHGISSVSIEPERDGPGSWYIGNGHDGEPFRLRSFPKSLTDFEQRRAWLDRNGIDVQFVSVWGEMHGYNLDPDDSSRWCRLINETMLDAVSAEPRLRSYATVPLGDPQRSADEVRWAEARGFVGVMSGVHAGINVLADAHYDPLWKAASETGMVVYLHPDYPHWNCRIDCAEVANSAGRLSDTATALASLLAGGVFDRFPDLQVLGAHAGGGIPFMWPRIRHCMKLEGSPYVTADLPSGLHFDTVTFDSRVLEHMIDLVGIERFLLGSDFPLPNGDRGPTETVRNAVTSEADHQAVMTDNVDRLLHPR